MFKRKTTPEWYDDTPVTLLSASIISLRNTVVTEDKLITIRRRRNWLLLPVTGNMAFPAIVSSCRQRAVSSTECGFFGHRLALSLQIHQLGNLENGWWVWEQCDRAPWQRYIVPSKTNQSVYPASNMILKNWNLFRGFITRKTTRNLNTSLHFFLKTYRVRHWHDGVRMLDCG